MSLSVDDKEIAMMIPHRADIPLVEYLPLVFLTGAEELLHPEPEHLAIHAGSSAILFSSETEDDGALCHFQEWDMDAMALKIAPFSMEKRREHQESLIFVLARPYILGFFADWKYEYQGVQYFHRPQRVLRRQARKSPRICIEGNIIIRRKREARMTSVIARLYDFSLSGASFYTDHVDFEKNEIFQVTFEIPRCGVCETMATTVRVEPLSHPVYGYLVGIRFALNEQQYKEAQKLFLPLE